MKNSQTNLTKSKVDAPQSFWTDFQNHIIPHHLISQTVINDHKVKLLDF